MLDVVLAQRIGGIPVVKDQFDWHSTGEYSCRVDASTALFIQMHSVQNFRHFRILPRRRRMWRIDALLVYDPDFLQDTTW